MSVFATLTADQIILSVLATIALRELLVQLLPATLAGPDGWLIRTPDDR